MKDLEKQVGQLFMIGFQGAVLTSELREVLSLVRPGGIILFKRNVENPHQLAQLCKDIQKEVYGKEEFPLFVAIDQEGGVVTRLGDPFTQFSSQGELSDDGYDQVFKRGSTMAYELKLVGINLNLAPVLDVRRSDDSTKNFFRSFSSEPNRVASMGIGLIRGLQQNGVMACAKHFPGLGEARVDPHVDLPTVNGDLEPGLIPFRAAIAQDVATVMISHALYPNVDPDHQASLSQSVIEGLLRTKMGYRGVVLTDDLEMGAVAKSYSLPECTLRCFGAGADVLLICSKLGSVAECYTTVLEAVKKEDTLRKRLKDSLDRIIRLKKRYLSPYVPPNFEEIDSYFGRKR